MGKKVKLCIEHLEDGFLAEIKTRRIRGNKKVSSDTLKGLLKKVVPRIATAYGETIYLDDLSEDE